MFFNSHKKNGRLAASMAIQLLRAAATKQLMRSRSTWGLMPESAK